MGNECPMSVRSPFYLLRMEHRIEGEERDRTEWEGEGGRGTCCGVRPSDRARGIADCVNVAENKLGHGAAARWRPRARKRALM